MSFSSRRAAIYKTYCRPPKAEEHLSIFTAVYLTIEIVSRSQVWRMPPASELRSLVSPT